MDNVDSLTDQNINENLSTKRAKEETADLNDGMSEENVNLEITNYKLVPKNKQKESKEKKYADFNYINENAFEDNGVIRFNSPKEESKKVKKGVKYSKNKKKNKKNLEKTPNKPIKDLLHNATFSPAHYFENLKKIYTAGNSPIRRNVHYGHRQNTVTKTSSPNTKKSDSKKNNKHFNVNPDFNFKRALNDEKRQKN